MQNDEPVRELTGENFSAILKAACEHADCQSVVHLIGMNYDLYEIVEAKSMKMMPTAPGTCIQCATRHDETYPHNYFSITYQMRFKMRHGRDATHEDTIAHLPEWQRDVWREHLKQHPKVKWNGPPEGVEPIAEKYVESTGGK